MTPITERLAEALRPCPNGHNAKMHRCKYGVDSLYASGWFYVDCEIKECGWHCGGFPTEVEAAAHWNLRTHPAEGGEERDYVLVPREPTQAMVDAARRSGFEGQDEHVRQDWSAMLAAAPPPQPVAPERGEAKAVAYDDLREAAEDVLDRFHWMLSPDAKGNHTVKDLSVKAVLRLCEKILATPQPPPAPGFRDPTIEDANALAESLQKIIRVYGITLANIRVGVPDPKEYAARALKEAADIEGAALNAIGAKVEEK